jgi:hypothetical protein
VFHPRSGFVLGSVDVSSGYQAEMLTYGRFLVGTLYNATYGPAHRSPEDALAAALPGNAAAN